VIEVLSQGTARRDRREKLALYAQAGVVEYWLAEFRARKVEFLVNDDGRFVAALPVGGVYRSEKLPEVYLDLAELWRNVDANLPPRR
jgi:Uma2 family endonuclease